LGHYLEEQHTYDHFRDVWYSDLFDRTILDEWRAQGQRRFADRLRDKTRKVTEHEPAPLPDGVVAEMDRMAEHWE
jgi:trimethylamine--corrinoid protein Co-methyltransferase